MTHIDRSVGSHQIVVPEARHMRRSGKGATYSLQGNANAHLDQSAIWRCDADAMDTHARVLEKEICKFSSTCVCGVSYMHSMHVPGTYM